MQATTEQQINWFGGLGDWMPSHNTLLNEQEQLKQQQQQQQDPFMHSGNFHDVFAEVAHVQQRTTTTTMTTTVASVPILPEEMVVNIHASFWEDNLIPVSLGSNDPASFVLDDGCFQHNHHQHQHQHPQQQPQQPVQDSSSISNDPARFALDDGCFQTNHHQHQQQQQQQQQQQHVHSIKCEHVHGHDSDYNAPTSAPLTLDGHLTSPGYPYDNNTNPYSHSTSPTSMLGGRGAPNLTPCNANLASRSSTPAVARRFFASDTDGDSSGSDDELAMDWAIAVPNTTAVAIPVKTEFNQDMKPKMTKTTNKRKRTASAKSKTAKKTKTESKPTPDILYNDEKGVLRDAKKRQRFACTRCSKTFLTQATRSTHMATHKAGGKDKLQRARIPCSYAHTGCIRTYVTAEGLRLHIRNHHEIKKDWVCRAKGCERQFVRQADLRMHIIRMHSGDRAFPCGALECHKSFACQSELTRHMRSCHKGLVSEDRAKAKARGLTKEESDAHDKAKVQTELLLGIAKAAVAKKQQAEGVKEMKKQKRVRV